MLLDESDLKELGFLMGPRKQLLHWIRSHTSHSAAVTPETPRQTVSTPCSNTPVSPQPSTSAAASSRIRKFEVTTIILSH